MCACVCVQLVRLLFWNRHSREPRVELDEEDMSTPTATSDAAAAAAAGGGGVGSVNVAYSPDDDSAVSSASAYRRHGLLILSARLLDPTRGPRTALLDVGPFSRGGLGRPAA